MSADKLDPAKEVLLQKMRAASLENDFARSAYRSLLSKMEDAKERIASSYADAMDAYQALRTLFPDETFNYPDVRRS